MFGGGNVGLVPFANAAAENRALRRDLLRAFGHVLDHGMFIGGAEVERFEGAFSEYHGVAHAVAVNSGTDALRLTLLALNLPSYTVGISVANTFVATIGAMVSAGISPVLVDVGDDENIDPQRVQEEIDRDTKVVIAVHLRGRPAPVTELRAICEQRGVVLIEDCSQAVGAMMNGQSVGTFGLAGCFSLHPLKNLGATGDAGIIVTNSEALASELKLLRNHGLVTRDKVVRWAENSRLDSLQAAALLLKLPYLNDWTAQRIELAATYSSALQHLPIVLPRTDYDHKHVFHRYVIRTSARDHVRRSLARNGVETLIHYPVPLHLQPASSLKVRVASAGLPRTEADVKEIVSLPLYPGLTSKQVHHVAHSIEDALDSAHS